MRTRKLMILALLATMVSTSVAAAKAEAAPTNTIPHLTSHSTWAYYTASTARFRGTGTPGAAISVTVYGSRHTVYVNRSGTWQFPLMYVPRYPKEYTFTSWMKDQPLRSSSVQLWFVPTVPRTNAVPRVTSPSATYSTADRTIRFWGTGTPYARIAVWINGKPARTWVPSTGRWATRPVTVPRGVWSVTVTSAVNGQKTVSTTFPAAAGERSSGIWQVSRQTTPRQGKSIAVKVEKGLPYKADAVAREMLDILNDRRGWAGKGYRFHLTSADRADIVLHLASGSTVDTYCYPMNTQGYVSCSQPGGRVYLNVNRWRYLVPHFNGDWRTYRRYLVSHEVGHSLGYGHRYCPRPGAPAPVMQQQTYSLQGCRANGWIMVA